MTRVVNNSNAGAVLAPAPTGVLGEHAGVERHGDSSAYGVSNDLITQLGLEYFIPDVKPESKGTSTNPEARGSGGQSVVVPIVAPSEREERDFWDDVAALTIGSTTPSPNALGTKPDLVAYAIAAVSARYTLYSGESRHASGSVNTLVPSRSTSPSTPATSNSVTASGHADMAEYDLSSVLETFFEFERSAALNDVRELDPGVFELTRERAAKAVIAANLTRNAAMKAAQGRRG